MIDAVEFLRLAHVRGVDVATGVPCSYLTPVINAAASRSSTGWSVATSEGEAIAIAAGAWLAGRTPLVMMQNSGLGNAVNPLTSLNAPFHIPALLRVSRRGAPGHPDEPQHELMGAVTPDLLSLIGVAHERCPAAPGEIAAALDRALHCIRVQRRPYAFIVEKGDFLDSALDEPVRAPKAAGVHIDLSGTGPRPPRMAAMAAVLARLPADTPVIATTGFCGRELYTLGDEDRFFYLVGSMGGASAIGLGVAMHVSALVVVFDGDGAALMKLGNLATIGALAPSNLLHIVFDNEVHASTGGQQSVSAGVDFAAVALACGYRLAISCTDLDGLAAAIGRAVDAPGPVLIHAKVGLSDVASLARPAVSPRAVADRFRTFLRGRS